jgi:O-antigen ligase
LNPRVALACALLTLSWLNPFAPGPTPAMVPWLVALACVAALLGLRTLGAIDWPRAAASAWLLAGGISCAIGIVQYFGLSAPLFPWVNNTPLGEAFANLRQRNQFASLAHIALAALWWWAGRGRGATWMVLLAVLLGMGNAVSSSRTGLFQTLLLLGLAWWWGGLRQVAVRRVLCAFVLAYVAALLVLPLLIGLSPWSSGAWARLQAGDALCSSRLTLWRNVLALIAEHPWLGWGWGELDYAHFIHLYDGPRFCDILDNAHNLPLHLAVELGVPVALLVCGLLLWWVLRARPWAEADATRQMAWAVLVVLGLHSLLEYPLWYGPFQMALGMCVVFLWRETPGKFIRNTAMVQVEYAATAILLIAICGYTAWDYHRISQMYMPPEARDPAYQTDTLRKTYATRLFQNQVQFADLAVTPLTPANAAVQHAMALDLLHFSPERRVVERVIDSALLLGQGAEAVFYLQRYKAAFPMAYADWLAARQLR